MLDNEKMAELKRNCELLLEFIELINGLSMRVEVLKKEKQYYMDEYKKTSDLLRDMRRQKEEQGKNKSTVIKCEDRNCRYNVNSVCQAGEITVNGENTCLLSEQKPTSAKTHKPFPSLDDVLREQARRKNCCEANNKKSKEVQ